MSRHSLAVPLMLCAVLLTTSFPATGQDTPINLPGLATNQLQTPGQPTNLGTNCTGGSCGSTYIHGVAAADFAGGSTIVGSTNSIATGWGTLNPAQYIFLTTPMVSGAKNCTVYRVPSTGMGTPLPQGTNVPCGSVVYDFGITGSPGSTPTVNTTGGMNALGMVNAQAFNAKGAGAGTEILTVVYRVTMRRDRLRLFGLHYGGLELYRKSEPSRWQPWPGCVLQSGLG